MARSDHDTLDERHLLEIFSTYLAQSYLFWEAPETGEDSAGMLCVFRVFHPHLGRGSGLSVLDEIVGVLYDVPGQGWIECDEVFEIDNERTPIADSYLG